MREILIIAATSLFIALLMLAKYSHKLPITARLRRNHHYFKILSRIFLDNKSSVVMLQCKNKTYTILLTGGEPKILDKEIAHTTDTDKVS